MDIREYISKYNIQSEDLDDIVHEAASRLASNSNNDGIKSQIDFLTIVCGWSDEDILKEFDF
jgi:hypothetical protein